MQSKIYNMPAGAAFVLRELQNNGFRAYAVGGCVRDSILGREPNDWDICTEALPEQTKELFLQWSEKCRVLETGMKHGTVTVMVDGVPFEVTTFRIDGGYSDNRHPDNVCFTPSLTEDLGRRDFTINAMAYNPAQGLQDPFHGMEDLQFGLLRCVGDPDKRFREDALRILRALRFASTYRMTIEENTRESLLRNRELLKSISAERVREELMRLLAGQDVCSILTEFRDVFAVIIPELTPTFDFEQHNKYHCYDVWRHTVAAVGACPCDPDIHLTMLLHDLGKPGCFSMDEAGQGHFYSHQKLSERLAEDILQRLKFDNQSRHDIVELVAHHDIVFQDDPKFVRRMLNRFGREQFERMLLVQVADISAQSEANKAQRLAKLAAVKAIAAAIVAEQQCFSLKDLAISGGDLIAVGYESGPALGSMLNELLSAVLENPELNTREQLLSFAKSKQGKE